MLRIEESVLRTMLADDTLCHPALLTLRALVDADPASLEPVMEFLRPEVSRSLDQSSKQERTICLVDESPTTVVLFDLFARAVKPSEDDVLLMLRLWDELPSHFACHNFAGPNVGKAEAAKKICVYGNVVVNVTRKLLEGELQIGRGSYYWQAQLVTILRLVASEESFLLLKRILEGQITVDYHGDKTLDMRTLAATAIAVSSWTGKVLLAGVVHDTFELARKATALIHRETHTGASERVNEQTLGRESIYALASIGTVDAEELAMTVFGSLNAQNQEEIVWGLATRAISLSDLIAERFPDYAEQINEARETSARFATT